MQTIGTYSKSTYSKPLSTLLHFFGMVCYDFSKLSTKELEAYLPYFSIWEKLFEGTQTAKTLKQLHKALLELCQAPTKHKEATLEFHSLFNNPDPSIPLWESVARSHDKLMFGSHTFAVKEWYQAFGLELAKPHEASDYIALEILFMANLIERMERPDAQNNQAEFEPQIDNENKHTTPVAEDIVWSFWNEHLGQWGATCIQGLIPSAKTEFWRCLLSSCYDVLSIMENTEQ